MTDTSGEKCCFGSTIVFLIIISIITAVSITEDSELYYSYEETQCKATKVVYPTSIENSSLWGKCRCGKKCYSLSPIIKIYVDITKNNITKNYLLNENYDNKDYTHLNYSCDNINNIITLNKYLKNAKYFSTIINHTFTCYFSDEHRYPIIYKYDYLENPSSYILFIIIGISSLCGICQICCCYDKIFDCKNCCCC